MAEHTARAENRDGRLVLCKNLREKIVWMNKDLWEIKEKFCCCSVPAGSSHTTLSPRKRQMLGQLESKPCAAASATAPFYTALQWEPQVIWVDLGSNPMYYSATDISLCLHCSCLWSQICCCWCRHASQMHWAPLHIPRHSKCIYLPTRS